MKTKKWLKIITDDGAGQTAQDIQAEIDALKNEMQNDTDTVDKLKKSLIESKRTALGGGSKTDVKPLEEKIAATLDKTESISLVIIDLEKILQAVIEKERADRLKQIVGEIADLRREEETLWTDFSDHYARAAAIFFMIKGRPYDSVMGEFAQPFVFGTERHKTLKDEISTLTADTNPIADLIRDRRAEYQKIKEA